MSGLDPKRLVKITSVVESSVGKTEYRHGTGYLITGDLILTAKHVLPKGKVQQISYFVHARSKEWRNAELELAWEGQRVKGEEGEGEELDAVLLRINPPLDDLPLQEFLNVLPEKNVVWGSAGYPTAATQESDEGDKWKSIGLEGKLYVLGGGGHGDTELDLTVDAAPEGDGWRGISGAPVFVDDKLAGIIKSTLKEFKGTRLAGLPISQLLRAPGFLNAIYPGWLGFFPVNPWCLLLVSETQAGMRDDLRRKVRSAISRKVREQGGINIEEEPKVVVITEALESRPRWLRFVQAICAAPVMVIDVTKFNPAVMLMLGIRAVVKRGVTVTITWDEITTEKMAAFPFNIKETKLISFADSEEQDTRSPQHPGNRMGQAILDGLNQLKGYPGYLDLPAYDAVRCPEPKARAKDKTQRGSDINTEVKAADLQTVQQTVLMLCPFRPEYEKPWRYISNAISDVAIKDMVRMLDIMSPRLVGQALYEHVRWSHCCIVDWTHWRPNVFFELGVRLACSNVGPVCLIDERITDGTEDDPPPIQKEQLINLLDPIKYKYGGSLEPFEQAWQRYQSYVNKWQTSLPESTLEHDETYRTIAFEAFDWEQESIIKAPHEELKTSVETHLGKDPENAGKFPALFSSHPKYMPALQLNAAERLIAAWYYFIKRYEEKITTDDSLKKQAIELGNTALGWIPKRSEYKVFRDEINEMINELSKSK